MAILNGLLVFLCAFAIPLAGALPIRHEDRLKQLLCSDYGYTLLGAKPLSFTDFFDCGEDAHAFALYLNEIFHNSSQFTLRLMERDGKYWGAYLINHHAFKQIGADPKEPFIFETSRIGELFGYGKHNAAFYMRWVELGRYFNKLHPPISVIPKRFDAFSIRSLFEPRRMRFQLIGPKHNPDFASLLQEWESLNSQKLTYSHRDAPPFLIRLPVFVAKRGPETDRLLELFHKTADKIGKLLHQSDWKKYVYLLIGENHDIRSSFQTNPASVRPLHSRTQ